MKTQYVHIDYDAMARAFSQHVREKAARVNGTIIYMRNGEFIEENPKSRKKTVIKLSSKK